MIAFLLTASMLFLGAMLVGFGLLRAAAAPMPLDGHRDG